MLEGRKVCALWSPKGGAGCSSVAIGLARSVGGSATLVDASRSLELMALVGMARAVPDETESMTGLVGLSVIAGPAVSVDSVLALAESGEGPLIVDVGAHETDAGRSWFGVADRLVCVLGTHYLDLRGFTSWPTAVGRHFDGAVVLSSAGSSIGVADVSSVTGLPVLATVPRLASIARAIDAGVIITRMPDALARPMGELARRLELVRSDAVTS